jgi:hypothetical protein
VAHGLNAVHSVRPDRLPRMAEPPAENSAGRIRSPRALAGHLRRAQTFLRALGIDMKFSREGRAGTRVIRIRRLAANDVGAVGSVSSVHECGSESVSEELCLDRSGAAMEMRGAIPG